MNAIGIIDCNNFYASCERRFQPALRKKPVAVLSNNDGCVIARSQEIKDMGVPMGAPLFKWQEFMEKRDAKIFSSNYELYDDMSSRVMESLYTFTPEVEVYWIDEAFLGLQTSRNSFDYLGRDIQDKVYKWTGIPVGVGIAETKTLAKVANRLGKKSEKAKGVLDLYKSPYTDLALERTAIGDVWGIGRATAAELLKWGVDNAKKFKYLNNHKAIKKHFSVVGLRIFQELNGVPCIPLQFIPKKKKSIACTRSFGEPVTDGNVLFNAVSTFLGNAVAKLRENRLAARALTVFVKTSQFKDDFYGKSFTFKSAYPSDNLFELQHWLGNSFDEVFRSGLVYKKAGVELTGLIPREGITTRMYHEERLATRIEKLNSVMDEINRKHGSGTVHLAVARGGDWQTKVEKRSPRYTTRFNEILTIN